MAAAAAAPNTISMSGLRMLVHGGPGTGKTFFVDRVLSFAKYFGFEFIVGALCASAASILPMGETLHSITAIGRPKNKSNRGSVQNDQLPATLPAISASRLDDLQKRYSKAKFIVIDEVSMVSVVMLSHISDRLKQIMRCDDDFGGLGILTLNFR